MPSDDYILTIAGHNFTKLAWMVHLIILMHQTVSDTKFLDAGGDMGF